MPPDNSLADPLTEWTLEEGWQLRRKFAREIEEELDIKEAPIELLLFSVNLQKKWLDFVIKN